MKLIFFFIVSTILIACNYEASEGPRLIVSSSIDSVYEADTFYLEYSFIQGSHAIRSTQIEFDTDVLLDSIIHTNADTNTFRYPISCINKTESQTIFIRVYDSQELEARAQKNIYIRGIVPPRITLDTISVYTDTTVSKNSDIHFTIHCIQTEQKLDSLYISKNNTIISDISLTNAQFIGDTTTQIIQHTLDSVGVFIFDIRLQDIFGKQKNIIKKITVQ